MTDKLLLTIADVSERLSLGRSKIYELVSAGVIESVSIGRARRVPRAALEEYIARLRSGDERGP